jgi:hypothetical protein
MTINPVTSGLVIDLAAGPLSATKNDLQTFATWPDSSGQSNDCQFINGNQFTFKTSVTPLNGPAVRFFSTGAGFPDPNHMFTGATGAEVFAVVHNLNNSGQPSFYQFGGNDLAYYPWVDGNVYDGSFTNSRYSFPIGVDSTNWHIYNIRHDGTTRTTAIDGTIAHTVNTAFVNPANSPLSSLGLGGGGGSWQGEIAEFVVYNRCLTPTERTSVYDYLRHQHLQTFVDPNLDLPAIGLGIGVHGSLPATVDVLEADPITLVITTSAGTPLRVDPIGLSVGMFGRASDAVITLTAPVDGDTVEVSNPQFVVALNAHDPTIMYTIEIQYATSTAFASPVTLSGNASGLDGGVFLTPSTPVPNTTYWRARLLLAGEDQTGWSDTLSFTVDTSLTPATTQIIWTVGNAGIPIHLWHLDPPAAAPGDTVTAYGQGFPVSGHVTFNGAPVVVTDWTRQPADSASGTPDRVIDRDNVDPEHWEVTFIVPDYTGPGAALAVTT